uniref:c-type cytochrome n=1 Tax=Pararhizobium sp. IMCC3301 TaxID=3067904 RepID=UPI0027420DB2|nr:cytochrome c [Pararhizobium sp. IMCC3301]
MLRHLIKIGLVLGLLGFGAFWYLTMPQQLSADQLPAHTPDPEQGAYIFAAGGCSSCHAAEKAKGDDRLILGGGRRFETQFGTFIASNISPDPKAGIGSWSALDFVNAVTRGVSPEGAHYYPAFPYTSYRQAKITDILDLKAYMDTLPPVADAAPASEVGFPFNMRRGLGLWKMLFMDQSAFEDDPSQTPQINRGAYLVNTLGHCAQCHTPRNHLGASDTARAMAGAPNPDGKGFIPNITPHPDGIGNWSQEDIAYALETGFTPDFDSLGGSMVAVVENTAQLTTQDREAIAAYLKSLPPLPKTGPDS